MGKAERQAFAEVMNMLTTHTPPLPPLLQRINLMKKPTNPQTAHETRRFLNNRYVPKVAKARTTLQSNITEVNGSLRDRKDYGTLTRTDSGAPPKASRSALLWPCVVSFSRMAPFISLCYAMLCYAMHGETYDPYLTLRSRLTEKACTHQAILSHH